MRRHAAATRRDTTVVHQFHLAAEACAACALRQACADGMRPLCAVVCGRRAEAAEPLRRLAAPCAAIIGRCASCAPQPLSAESAAEAAAGSLVRVTKVSSYCEESELTRQCWCVRVWSQLW